MSQKTAYDVSFPLHTMDMMAGICPLLEAVLHLHFVRNEKTEVSSVKFITTNALVVFEERSPSWGHLTKCSPWTSASVNRSTAGIVCCGQIRLNHFLVMCIMNMLGHKKRLHTRKKHLIPTIKYCGGSGFGKDVTEDEWISQFELKI